MPRRLTINDFGFGMILVVRLEVMFERELPLVSIPIIVFVNEVRHNHELHRLWG